MFKKAWQTFFKADRKDDSKAMDAQRKKKHRRLVSVKKFRILESQGWRTTSPKTEDEIQQTSRGDLVVMER